MPGQGVSERRGQKQRTRADLLRAAREIVGQGGSPTVAEVADAAGISRATAYRYFSTPEQIVREAVLDGISDEMITLPAADAGRVEDNLDVVVQRICAMLAAKEELFRAFLASTLDGASDAKRSGRRIAWLETVLEPRRHELSPPQFQRLVHALCLVTGIEALVVLKDVCQLNEKQAEKVLRWVAQAVLAHGGEEAPRAARSARRAPPPPGSPIG